MKTDRSSHHNTDQPLRRSWRLALVTPLLCLLGACATNKNLQPARATPGTGEGGFELADTNHDGKLSRAEASDFIVGQIFDATDANHDGHITKEEFTHGDPSRAHAFKERDANHDGIVTRDEAIAYGRKHGVATKAFHEIDKNHDGYLSKAEVQAYYKSREGNPN